MKSRTFLASLLAGTIALCGLVAGKSPQPSRSDDVEKAERLLEEKAEPLTALADRIQKMLDAQIVVRDGIKSLHKIIQDTPDKKPRPEDKKAALKLAEKEKDIVREATKVIKMLEKEAAAFAFTEVFREVRKDMERLQGRLESGDVGADTQALGQTIIESLEDMIGATKPR
jgi:hypothetical protein